MHAQTLAKLAEHLRDDEIHVWCLDYRPQHGRTPLLSVLAAYLGTDAEHIALTTGEHGRPALALTLDQSLGFNWSHSGSHAVIAIGRHVTPGIDVEQVRERPRALAIAERFFSAGEVVALAGLPPVERTLAFLELWTAKEAVLKALGRGLAFGLDRLSVAVSAGRLSLQQLEGDDVDAWQLHRLDFDAALVTALAWRGRQRRIRLGRLASDD